MDAFIETVKTGLWLLGFFHMGDEVVVRDGNIVFIKLYEEPDILVQRFDLDHDGEYDSDYNYVPPSLDEQKRRVSEWLIYDLERKVGQIASHVQKLKDLR